MDDPYNLNRFVEAQNRVYDQVCSELRQGSKRGHWMWFVFPQIKGLGYRSDKQVFKEALQKFFGSQDDQLTLDRL